MRSFLRNASLFGLGLAAGCQQLEPIPENECGNGVVEPGESCDSGNRGAPDPFVCRKPRATRQCQIDCSVPAGSDTRNLCPAGWGCGADDICHQPGAGFVELGETFGAGARQIRIADFNGDGRNDVLAVDRTELRAYYFGEGGVLQSTYTLSIDNALPTVGQLTDGDSRADIAVATPGGVSVLLGRSDGAFSPTVYSSGGLPSAGARIMGVEVLPEAPENDKIINQGEEAMAITEEDGVTRVIFVRLDKPEETPPTLYKLMGHPVADLDDEIPVGQIIEDAITSPCEEIVLAFKGKSDVLVATPCQWTPDGIVLHPLDTLDPAPPSKVTLAGVGTKLAGGVKLFDVNFDGHLDLIIAVEDPESDSVVTQVSFGVGDGTFHSDLLTVPMSGGDGLASWFSNEKVPFPLAVGYINVDLAVDLVLKQGVFVSGPGDPMIPGDLTYVFRGAPSGSEWTHARIGDFNGNLIPDVIATSRDDVGVDFFNGAGDGTFSHFTIPTQGHVPHIASGDFDGDSLLDLAIVDQATGDADDALSVLFGRREGAPEPPITMGRIGKIQQLVEARLFDPREMVLDGTSEIGLVSSKQDEGQQVRLSLAILSGSTDRLLQSPFGLSRSEITAEGKMDYVNTPVQCVIGDFAPAEAAQGEGAHLDLAVLTRQGDCPECEGLPTPTNTTTEAPRHYLWLAESAGEAELDVADTIDSDELMTGPASGESIVAPVDLDNDGIQELVLFSLVVPEIGGPGEEMGDLGRVSVFESSLSKPTDSSSPYQWKLRKSYPTAEGYLNSTFLLGNLPVELPLGRIASSAVADFDLDGYLDVAVLGTFLEDESSDILRDRIVVFWNDTQGGLDVDGRSVLPDLPLSGLDQAAQAPNAFAVIDIDAFLVEGVDDIEPEIVAITDEGAYSFDRGRDGDPRAFADPVALGAVKGGKAIVFADMNRDGLDDLITASEATMQIFVRSSRNP